MQVSILKIRSAVADVRPSVYSTGRHWVMSDSQLEHFAEIILKMDAEERAKDKLKKMQIEGND